MEEVQMPPRVRLGVMHLAPGHPALRARKPSPLPEVDPQIQPTPLGIELDVHHLPRLHEAERLLKEVEIVHARLPSSKDQKPASSHHARTDLPTRNSEGPNYPEPLVIPRSAGLCCK